MAEHAADKPKTIFERKLGNGLSDSAGAAIEAHSTIIPKMKDPTLNLVDGATCQVVAGTHKGKSGVVRDINTSKTGAVTITVVPSDGVRFKTLAKNVAILR